MANIITLAEVKEYLNITAVSLDTYFTNQLPEVTKFIEDIVGGAVVVNTYTETLNGSGCDSISINNPPINTSLANPVTLLQYRNSPRDAWTDLITGANFNTDILVDASNPYFVYLYSIGFPFGYQNIKITYSAGYSTIPSIFKKVALEMVSEKFSESKMGTGRLGVSSKSLQAGSDSYFRLSDIHLKELNPYIWRHK